MEAQFSDAEFSDILGAFAEVDDMLIGWDVVMTPASDILDVTKPVDQRHNTAGASYTAFFEGLEDDFVSSTSGTLLGVGSTLHCSAHQYNGSRPGGHAGVQQTTTELPQASNIDIIMLPPSSAQCQSSATAQAPQEAAQPPQTMPAISPQQIEQLPHQHQVPCLGDSGWLSPQLSFEHQASFNWLQHLQDLAHNQLLPHLQHQQLSLQQHQQLQLQQQEAQFQSIFEHMSQRWNPQLTYTVQTPSSSLAAEHSPLATASGGTPTRGSLEVSTTAGGNSSALTARVSGTGALVGPTAEAYFVSAVGAFGGSGGLSDPEGDAASLSSAVSHSAPASSQSHQAVIFSDDAASNTAAAAAAGSIIHPAALPSMLLQGPAEALVTTTGKAGTGTWAPVAYLSRSLTSAPAPGGASSLPTQSPQLRMGPPDQPAPVVTEPKAFAPLLLPLLPREGQDAGLLPGSLASMPVDGLLPMLTVTTMTGGGVSSPSAQPPAEVIACGAATTAAAANSASVAEAASVGSFAACTQTPVVAADRPPDGSVIIGEGGTAGAAENVLHTPQPQPHQTHARASTAATPATTTTAGMSFHPEGMSGARLLAELVAEAAAGGWAAVATAMAPLPPGTGRTAEELLAGLDLQEVFAPSKPSHAKRIRGHVRRAADLKAQLAERVRTIQRLAAENAVLHGRAKVLGLVVRCRDEQLRVLRNYRTSPDGKTYYVDHPAGVGEATTVFAERAGGEGGEVPLPYVRTSTATLAAMPASELLDLFQKMISDISESLAELEAEVNAMQCDATAGTLCSKVTHGSINTAEMSSLSSPCPEVPGVSSARQGEILAHCRHQHHTTPVADSAGGCNPGASENGALARLRHKMAVFRNVIRYVGLVNEEACKITETTLNGVTVPPDSGHWMRVAQGLGLSQHQLADTAALHSCWHDWLGRIHAERRSVAAALDQLLSVNRYGAAYFESVGQYGTDRDVIHKMHANVMRERILIVLTGEVFCCHILTDIQWARAIVTSYPYILDVQDLVRAASQLYYSMPRGLRLACPS